LLWIFEWNDGGGGGGGGGEEEDGALHLMLRWLTCWVGWVWQGIKETNACNIVVENLER
jgi:hypothetical protein